MQRTVHLGKRILSMAAAAVLAVGCVAIPAPAPQAEPETATLPYMDTKLSFEERAADLVSRMTLEEKVSQMGSNNPAVSRLGVSKYDYWTECLHGVARLGKATSFPYSIAMAASWDPAMIEQITNAISDEARGYANGTGRGLSYYSPTINMARDPRWGRDHESYGEDPYLTGQIGASFVKGLQGDDETYLKVIATIKHYAANNSEYNRHTGTSNMDDRTLREYYTRAFKSVIRQVDVGAVMSSYNRVNGVPASASPYLLDTLLRKTFGFGGYVVSDCGAIEDITKNHKWVPEDLGRELTLEESVKYALAAGCDIDCGTIYPNYAKSAVDSGVLSEDLIDLELTRIFTARMKTGEFDPKENVPYRADAYSLENQVEAADHKQLAEDSANDGIVLLKNEKATADATKAILPLDINTQKNIVMVGDIANSVELGGYSGSPSEANTTTPVQGMQNLGAKVTYIKGGTNAQSGQYICNLKNVVITKADGSKVTLGAGSAKELKGCKYESDKGNIGFVEPGATLMFENVNIADAASISFELATDNAAIPGSITVNMESANGMQFATADTEKTGGWQTYKAVPGKLGSDLGGYTTQNLYVTFSAQQQEVSFAEEDAEKIRKADAVVVCLNGNTSGEGTDRSTIVMPAYQVALANTVAGLNNNTIVYLQTVGVVELGEFMDNVPAILWTCYNGQAQGNAMARVLYGEVNPNAKLPVTWYAKNAALPTIDDYNIRGEEDFAGWTYQYYKGEQTYPFGYGLSYTSYQYKNLQILNPKNTYSPDDTLTVSVNVTNTGDVDGKEVVQLYVAVPNNDGENRPFKQLKAFEKVAIQKGETKTVTLKLDLSDCYFWDEEQQKNVYDSGDYTLLVGPSSDEDDPNMQTTTFRMQGDLTPKLTVVTAKPDRVVLNAANTNKVITTEVTAAMNDDSFYDLENGDAKVTYESANDAIATVDDNGIVRAVSSGVTTITASVTIDGETLSDSFPVVVNVHLEDIKVNGQSLRDFRSDVTEYYVPLDTTTVPEVTVPGAPEGAVSIQNATAVPGTTTVQVSVAGVSSTYTLHFTKRSHDYVVARFSEHFDGTYATTRPKQTLENPWSKVDGDQPVDLTGHDLSDLRLRLVMKLEQTGSTIVADDQAYRGGFIKMKSSNNAEIGWYVGKMSLKTGVNYIDIPLTKLIDSRSGNIDWSQISELRFYIDSLNNYEGPFKATVSNTMVVDTSLNPEREALWELVNDGLDESKYTEASLVAYREAKAAIQSLIFKDSDVTEQEVAEARANYETAKNGLREDTYLVGTFSKSQRTSTVLGEGKDRKNTELYNDWCEGDGVPFDLSGDRKNLRLQMTVKFNSTNAAIKPEEIWDTLTIKLRSSDAPGENNYGWILKSTEFTDKETVQLSIDLSNPSTITDQRGEIDWSDVRRLIIKSQLSQKAIADPGNYTQFSMTVSDVKIVDLTNILEEKAEIQKLIDQSVNTTGAPVDAVNAYTDAKEKAVAICATEMATPAEVYYAHMALKDAIDALGGTANVTLGDVDGDTHVTIMDALMALQKAAGKINLDTAQIARADVDGKAGVTAADALLILKRATGNITVF